MKKISILIIALSTLTTFGLLDNKTATVTPKMSLAQEEAQCKYTVKDALAVLRSFTPLSVVIVSEDGSRKFLNASFHNPQSKNKDSVDGRVLLVIDSRMPGQELTLMTSVVYPTQEVLFKRIIKYTQENQPDGTSKRMASLTACFEKIIVPTK